MRHHHSIKLTKQNMQIINTGYRGRNNQVGDADTHFRYLWCYVKFYSDHHRLYQKFNTFN